jgi:hypothetical protein
MAKLTAAQQKQFINKWLDENGVQHGLTENSTVKEFETLAAAEGWDGEYIEEKKDDEEGHKFEGENPTFKMRFAGIIATRNGDRYDYVVEDANDLDAFKNAKASDAKSRGYTNNAEVGHHWAYEYEGKKATFKFSTAVNRLVVEKRISAAVALNAHKLTAEELGDLSPNAMRILELQMSLAAANKRLVAAE